jgi:segregation and condensation protein A
LLTKKYVEMLKTLKELDFNVSGKLLLAAAILVRIKSKKLVNEDITELDALMVTEEPDYEGFYDDLEAEYQAQAFGEQEARLYPRVPQPRERKVSVYDLVNALQKALEVKHRRVLRDVPAVKVEIPEKDIDITKLIKDLYARIRGLFKKSKKITFKQLVPSEKKEDKISTFVPLLHLAHVDQRKIDLKQKEHFGDIEIKLSNKDLHTIQSS